MIKYEKKSRYLHNQGNNCSKSIYDAFRDDYNLDFIYPKPRSIDGMCGVILISHRILKQLNKEEYIEEFNNKFLREFNNIKCSYLFKNKDCCNNYIGFASSLLSVLISG